MKNTVHNPRVGKSNVPVWTCLNCNKEFKRYRGSNDSTPKHCSRECFHLKIRHEKKLRADAEYARAMQLTEATADKAIDAKTNDSEEVKNLKRIQADIDASMEKRIALTNNMMNSLYKINEKENFIEIAQEMRLNVQVMRRWYMSAIIWHLVMTACYFGSLIVRS